MSINRISYTIKILGIVYNQQDPDLRAIKIYKICKFISCEHAKNIQFFFLQINNYKLYDF